MGMLAGMRVIMQRCANRAARDIARALGPAADLRKRAGELEIRGSTGNKLALADECSERRMHDEAVRLYESCLRGAYARDSTILFRLARAAVDAGQWDRAQAALARLKAEAPRTRPLEARLLEARVLEGRGQGEAALALYRELLPIFVGLEARYRFGTLLMKQGRRDAAMRTFDEILGLARRFAAPIAEEERWVAAARQALREG